MRWLDAFANKLTGVRVEHDPVTGRMIREVISGRYGLEAYRDYVPWTQDVFQRVFEKTPTDEKAFQKLERVGWGEVETDDRGREHIVFRYVNTIDDLRVARVEIQRLIAVRKAAEESFGAV